MQIDLAQIATIVAAVLTAIFGKEGVAWVWARVAARREAAQPSSPAHWTDVTGEIRPVMVHECNARHARLERDMERNEDRFESVRQEVVAMREQLARMNGELVTAVTEAVGNAMDRHERQFHKR